MGCKCTISVEINSNVSKMIQANSLFLNFQMKSPYHLVTLLFSHNIFRKFRFSIISEAISHFSAFGALILNMKVCCLFSLESPHRGDSNQYTQNTIFNMKKTIALNYSKSTAMGFSKELNSEFEIAVVNRPSVFEPLKVYCFKVNEQNFIFHCRS